MKKDTLHNFIFFFPPFSSFLTEDNFIKATKTKFPNFTSLHSSFLLATSSPVFNFVCERHKLKIIHQGDKFWKLSSSYSSCTTVVQSGLEDSPSTDYDGVEETDTWFSWGIRSAPLWNVGLNYWDWIKFKSLVIREIATGWIRWWAVVECTELN